MANQINPESECDQRPEETEQAGATELLNVGENLDMKGGRVLEIPDFVELALQGFSENELKDILKLRRRYNETSENEITPEFKRLRFARYMYGSGRMKS